MDLSPANEKARSFFFKITQSPALGTLRVIARKMLYVRYVGLFLQVYM